VDITNPWLNKKIKLPRKMSLAVSLHIIMHHFNINVFFINACLSSTQHGTKADGSMAS
jgi:hypothetical protein